MPITNQDHKSMQCEADKTSHSWFERIAFAVFPTHLNITVWESL